MVLDPGTALGIAGNVLQFVDFATRLVSKSTEYYKSVDGVLVAHGELSGVARSLRKLSRSLEASMRLERSNKSYSPAEKGLWDANNECCKLSELLIEALYDLKRSKSQRKWQSFRQALRSTWNEGRIEKLSNRLAQAREQLMTHLLVHLSSRQALNHKSILELDSIIQQNILDAIQKSSKSLKNQINTLSYSLEHAKAEDQPQILSGWRSANQHDLDQLSDSLFSVTENAQISDTQDRLLDSLYFTRLEERHDRISDAHEKTFKWVFGGVRDDGTKWDEFSKWLEIPEASKSVFWVCGKAGSGKSTLMRYLNDSNETTVRLKRWAGNQQLIVASCFFWKPGTHMQRSLVGMLRTLLHHILMQDKTLIVEASPLRWRKLYWGASTLEEWNDVELVRAMQTVVRLAKPKSRFALLVDGLDEFGGNDVQMQHLIDFFQALARHDHVKVCVSSRPWNIFQDAFAECPKLRLELLTEEDIRLYVQTTLDNSPRFRQLSLINLSGCLGLVSDVVEKASGVFLWVYLVVCELKKGLRNGHDLRLLGKRLDELPADLDPYFLQMLNSIELFERTAASKAFQIMLSAGPSLTTLQTLSFVDEEEVDFAMHVSVTKTLRDDVNDRNESMMRRVNSLCMGLLEAKRPLCRDLDETWKWEVDYLHRSVKDFLLGDQAQYILHNCTGGVFNTNRYLCNSFLSQMIYASTLAGTEYQGARKPDENPKSRLLFEFLEDFMFEVEEIEGIADKPPLALLSRAEKVFMEHLSVLNKSRVSHRSRQMSRVWEATERWEAWHCSFLTLAVQYNLVLYCSVQQMHSYKGGRPYLDFALRRWASNSDQALPPSPALVRNLILQGSNPNEIYNGDTIWNHFLRHMALIAAAHPDEEDLALYYETTEILIVDIAVKFRPRGLLTSIFGDAEKLVNTPVRGFWDRHLTIRSNRGHHHNASIRDRLLPWRWRVARR